mgnify:CR=1 FL=1
MAKKTVSKKTKATKATKTTKDSAVTQEAAPSPLETVSTSFNELLAQISALRGHLTSLTSQVRTLQKKTERELRLAQKAKSKRQRKSVNRAPSGFVKPTKISNVLAKFLGKPKGTEMARTEVTREINSYIRAHKLQDPKNGRRILPDKKLSSLLSVKKGDELTYFNLQRFMSPHFAKGGNEPVADSH